MSIDTSHFRRELEHARERLQRTIEHHDHWTNLVRVVPAIE